MAVRKVRLVLLAGENTGTAIGSSVRTPLEQNARPRNRWSSREDLGNDRPRRSNV